MQSRRDRERVWNGNRQGFGWDHLKLAHTILDDEALDIFRASATDEVSATEVSRRCHMPIARCYRWLRKLESLGLLVSREHRPAGGRTRARRYRSSIRSIFVSVQDDRIGTRIEVDAGATPIISEWTTTVEGSESVRAPKSYSQGSTGGANVVFHFVDPPRTKGDSRRKVPINLPAFLNPLPRPPGRR
jgi:hypothetical protein